MFWCFHCFFQELSLKHGKEYAAVHSIFNSQYQKHQRHKTCHSRKGDGWGDIKRKDFHLKFLLILIFFFSSRKIGDPVYNISLFSPLLMYWKPHETNLIIGDLKNVGRGGGWLAFAYTSVKKVNRRSFRRKEIAHSEQWGRGTAREHGGNGRM